jgi:hypothetical protein
VEEVLIGKSLTASIILRAIQLLRETVVPAEGTSHAEYRISSAVGFLFSFLAPLSKGITDPRNILTTGSANSKDTDDLCKLPVSLRRETISIANSKEKAQV